MAVYRIPSHPHFAFHHQFTTMHCYLVAYTTLRFHLPSPPFTAMLPSFFCPLPVIRISRLAAWLGQLGWMVCVHRTDARTAFYTALPRTTHTPATILRTARFGSALTRALPLLFCGGGSHAHCCVPRCTAFAFLRTVHHWFISAALCTAARLHTRTRRHAPYAHTPHLLPTSYSHACLLLRLPHACCSCHTSPLLPALYLHCVVV